VSKSQAQQAPKESWHRTLLERMKLDIPGLRPVLLEDAELFSSLMSLLKFRNRFRNLYADELEPKQTMEVQGHLENAERFLTFLILTM